jgi:hypothetical protein
MRGFSRRVPDGPVTKQASRGKLGFFVAGLATVLLIFWCLGPPADARDSAACEQYGCAEESPIRKASPAPERHVSDTANASASTSAPAEASAPAVASPAPTSSSTPLEAESPAPIEEELAIEGSDSSEAADSEELSQDPTASDGATDGDSYSTDLTTEEEAPLAGYPYAGEPCEDRYCGMKGVEGSVECAIYETASGKEVYGCANPHSYERKGCYQVIFYTETGKPYANLDTCSGERIYAPPEPPEGWFRYWEPPETLREPVHGSWMPHWDLCQKKSGALDYHCGLDGIPSNWECKIFYSTVHGTVRGCYSPKEHTKPEATRRGFFCADKLRLYDEAGRPLGTYKQCPKIRTEYCGKDQCGVREAPDGWWCRTEEWQYGDTYSGERRTFVRCADPHIEDYWFGKMQPKNENARCGVLLDERGKRVDEVPCGKHGQGGGVVGLWAGKEAEEADETLNGGESGGGSSRETGGQAPPAGAAGGPLGALVVAFSELVGGDDGTAADPEVAEPASPTSGVEPGTVSMEDPGAEPSSPPASSSAASGNSPAEGDDGSTGEVSRSVSPDLREAGPTGGVLAAGAVASSIKPPTEENAGDTHNGSSRRDRVSAEEEGSNLGSTWTAGFTLPSPLAEGAVSSIAKGLTGGWLGVAVPLAGLGAVGGVFALRRRFLG